MDEGLSGLERLTRSLVIGTSRFEVWEDHLGGGGGESGDRSQVVHAQLEVHTARWTFGRPFAIVAHTSKV